MVNKAFENDKVSLEVLKVFRRVRRFLKRDANARGRMLSLEEFSRLTEKLQTFTRNVVITAFHSGMQRSEILSLTWEKVNLHEK